ncbi:tol-pal system protein YbgF [Desulfuromonas acetoxidans]|uniref:Tetratricopeptide TPR_2 n=1 Tax=Desulfuromonas acetoxidans (strain DSM 684 / 11070) TaxID=281689 RepID=Q1JZD7_DESA6|nr:tol-pal system protein YbgF [Desulfuromonas acetoxidans]EAT15630.1 Tetratricopeptide TPR_2 [Desulfuromonas acetoxidans DSM 684]MBF0645743.1 tol-pal system protein YbgF [Desulfuromonas acetoxidans]NVD25223.1 tol-pal system protein YbgF [Desulfuromonas acetoxidans]NVE17155.1 tol-pal system protein YbgF [Desulfuromonas acetoxidans]
MRPCSYLTVIGLVLLSGCVPLQQTTSNQGAQINALKQRLTALEQRSISQPPSTDAAQLRNIARQQANLKAELDTLRVDLQSLTGRLEDQQHSIMQLREELTLSQNDLSLRVAALEEAKSQTPATATPRQPVTGEQPGVIEQPDAQPVAPAVQLNQRDEKPTAASATQDQPDALYHQALQLVQQGSDFTKSRDLFRQFIQSYPQHDLAVNAMYWIGETLYGDKQYESAILQFQDVIQKYPNHPKMPAALMKQGLAFYALGDVRNAKIILQKVVDNYPQTPEADKAQERLKSWQ